MIAGHVQHTEERSNPATGRRFHYLRVKTYGAVEVDVVADPTIVTGSPAVGGVVWGTFWLSGRLLHSQNEQQRGSLDRRLSAAKPGNPAQPARFQQIY